MGLDPFDRSFFPREEFFMPKHKHDEKPHKHEDHPKHGNLDAKHLNGIVQAYNFSPKGGVEGLLLTEGDRTVQVNIPSDASLMAAHAAAVGQAVQITASPEGHPVPDAEHPVYRLISFEPSNGTGAAVDGPSHEGIVSVEGIVSRFNYARHGEPNGVVLDNGDFLHLKPDGMKKAGLRVGQEVAAEGRARPMALGHRVIEVEVVDGVALGPKGSFP
jgi:hypothetical protein